MDALKYEMAPGSSCGAEERWPLLTGTAPSVSQCVVSLFHVTSFFPRKDVLKNLPGWAAALAAGAPRVQLRTWYAAWVEWVASDRKTPTEEYVASAGVDLLFAGQVHALHRLCTHGQQLPAHK